MKISFICSSFYHEPMKRKDSFRFKLNNNNNEVGIVRLYVVNRGRRSIFSRPSLLYITFRRSIIDHMMSLVT